VPIPKIIHQTVSDKNNMHIVLQENISRLKSLNKNWDYRLYDDQEIRAFISECYGSAMIEYYDQINPTYGAARSDFFRYLLLYKFGGVYLDIKSTATRSLDQVLNSNHVYLLSHWRNKPGQRFVRWGMHPECGPNGEFQQWHIVTVPQHPFLEAVISSVKKNIENYHPATNGVGWLSVLKLTGPIAYTCAIQNIQNKYDHNLVDIEDLGFQYSVFGVPGNELAHKHLDGKRYDGLRTPLVARKRSSVLPDKQPNEYRRNEPCPCGSGKRYKHCHGVLA
jgi:mannosyltransferase OCH1-like enzyme